MRFNSFRNLMSSTRRQLYNAFSVFIVLILFCSSIFAQSNAQIDSLFRNSYKVFELQRLPNGMYRDSKLFSGNDYHPISVSNTGMGLIALCIADSMEWINDAEEKVVSTLNAVNGNYPGFIPDRTPNGYFRHFMDVNTGNQAWSSEYSTIDTDILACGALFAKRYFHSTNVSNQVDALINSIDFGAAVTGDQNGGIYLTMDGSGAGIGSAITLPYNEYMIAAWLAKNLADNSDAAPQNIWNNYYEIPNNLPVSIFEGYGTLSDNNSSFLSGFVHQFNYYLCHHFTTSVAYLSYATNSILADKAWWQTNANASIPWGMGAGSAISVSYHADAINNNPDVIASPHVIAGYIPINESSKDDLLYLWNNNLGKYILPTPENDPILWRFSLGTPSWHPNEIIGVDHSVMFFGLATLPEYCGVNFFAKNNDFFTNSEVQIQESILTERVSLFPNPSIGNLMMVLGQKHATIRVIVTDVKGEILADNFYDDTNQIHLCLNLQQGIYWAKVITESMNQVVPFSVE